MEVRGVGGGPCVHLQFLLCTCQGVGPHTPTFSPALRCKMHSITRGKREELVYCDIQVIFSEGGRGRGRGGGEKGWGEGG